MKHYFYSHLVETKTVEVEVDTLVLNTDEKDQLHKLMYENIHHAVLDTILTHLKEHDKKNFLENLATDDHIKIWRHLEKSIMDVETKIKKTAEEVSRNLLEDIKEAKKKKK